jgi:hypothetical protein
MHLKNHVRVAIDLLPFHSETVGWTVVRNVQTGGLGVLETEDIRDAFLAEPDLIVITWNLGLLIDHQNASIGG